MRVLVTGAGGFIGRHVTARLERDREQVVVFKRGDAAPGATNVFVGPKNLADMGTWKSLPEGVDAIVHLAALNPSRNDPRASDLAALRRANVEATAALAARAAKEGVKRIVFVSTANVHRASGQQAIAETERLAPRTPYEVSKMEAEQAFWEGLSGSRTEGCILRPAPVYGAGGRGNMALLIKLARLPIPLPIQGLGGRRSLVAVDHLADVLVMCLDEPAAAGEVFLVADDGPLAPAAIVGALRRGWRQSPQLFSSPVRPLAMLAQMLGRAESWHQATAPFVLDTGRLREKLGWRSPLNAETKLQQLAAAGAFTGHGAGWRR